MDKETTSMETATVMPASLLGIPNRLNQRFNEQLGFEVEPELLQDLVDAVLEEIVLPRQCVELGHRLDSMGNEVSDHVIAALDALEGTPFLPRNEVHERIGITRHRLQLIIGTLESYL
jgi:hypothetical protein